jgi:hypothetical protein
MPSGPLREVGVEGLSVYFIQTKSAIFILIWILIEGLPNLCHKVVGYFQ